MSRGLFTERGNEMRFLILIFMSLFTLTASAYVVPTYRDIKPASQQMIEKQSITTPIVALANRVVTTNAGPTSAATVTISTFAAQPDVARNITITPTGTTGDVESCVITVNGTNIYSRSISETITFAADASALVAGLKAFKTVSSVVFPANCESGGFAATWIVGVGDVLGLDKCMSNAGQVIQAVFDGAYESTRPTCVADADEVEKNTCDINGTLNGSKTVELYYMQNFACKP